mmetsp:Transcript_27694/g.76231  ORF Transcript_27694/g.76231 Transcript_27694/m.76231 type:complete len:288 (+) Transcript_27694:3495-4358(+)
MKDAGHGHRVPGHVVPEENCISWPISVAQLHAVPPYTKVPPQVYKAPRRCCKVFRGWPIHDPTIVRHNFGVFAESPLRVRRELQVAEIPRHECEVPITDWSPLQLQPLVSDDTPHCIKDIAFYTLDFVGKLLLKPIEPLLQGRLIVAEAPSCLIGHNNTVAAGTNTGEGAVLECLVVSALEMQTSKRSSCEGRDACRTIQFKVIMKLEGLQHVLSNSVQNAINIAMCVDVGTSKPSALQLFRIPCKPFVQFSWCFQVWRIAQAVSTLWMFQKPRRASCRVVQHDVHC